LLPGLAAEQVAPGREQSLQRVAHLKGKKK
jgi:hypothetical protein